MNPKPSPPLNSSKQIILVPSNFIDNLPLPQGLVNFDQPETGIEAYTNDITRRFWIRMFAKSGARILDIVSDYRRTPSIHCKTSEALIEFLNLKSEQEICIQAALNVFTQTVTTFLEALPKKSPMYGESFGYYPAYENILHVIHSTRSEWNGTLLLITHNTQSQKFVGELYLNVFEARIEI